MLDLVDPQRAGRRSGYLQWQARFDEAGGLLFFLISAWYIKRQNAGARWDGASNLGRLFRLPLVGAAAVALIRFLPTIAFD